MPSEVRSFAVTIPAATPVTAPIRVPVALGPRVVERIRVRFPPGPSGLVGVAFGSAGVRVIPWGAQEWLVGDDEVVDTSLEGQITSGSWEIWAYNLGKYDHTVYAMFFVSPAVGPRADQLSRPIPIEALVGGFT